MTVAQLRAALDRFHEDAIVRVHTPDLASDGTDAAAECDPLDICRIAFDFDTEGPLLVTESL